MIELGDTIDMKLGKYKGNDIELCRTTSSRVGEEAAQMLMKDRIPFTRNLKKIPFFQRERYQGARRIWVITTNPGAYGRARRSLDHLDRTYRECLVVSNF